MSGPLGSWLAASPLPWLVLTLGCYLAAMALYRRNGCHPLLIPVFTAVIVVVGVLLITDTPYATYRSGVAMLGLLIGPATVALRCRCMRSARASGRCGCR